MNPDLRVHAAVFARVWADFLRERYAPSLVRDAGWKGPEALMGELIAASLSPATLPEDRIQAFQDALEADAVALLDFAVAHRLHEEVTAWVDYDPDRTLCDAAERAGISLTLRLPLKTHVSADAHGVTLKLGYGAADVVVAETKPGAVHRALVAWTRGVDGPCGADVPYAIRKCVYDDIPYVAERCAVAGEAFEACVDRGKLELREALALYIADAPHIQGDTLRSPR